MHAFDLAPALDRPRSRRRQPEILRAGGLSCRPNQPPRRPLDFPEGSFDPATLGLTTWHRGSYGGPPWVGTPSAGISGTDPMTTIGSDPAVGAALNGYATASFDGVANRLQAARLNSVCFSGTGTIWFLFYGVGPPPLAPLGTYARGNIFTDPANAETTFGFVTVGATPSVHACIYAGAYVPHSVACTSDAWHLAFCRFDGTNLGIKIDSAAWNSVACGNWTPLVPSVQQYGAAYTGACYFPGLLEETATIDRALSDGECDNVRSYVNARYGLAL